MAVTFTEENIKELRFHLEDAAVKCSERCLYQSAKWSYPRLSFLSLSITELLTGQRKCWML